MSQLTALRAESSRPQFEPEASDFLENTSFRGLGLNMRADEARRAVTRLGFTLLPFQTSRHAMVICHGRKPVGMARFHSGRIGKLELTPEYFVMGKVVLREFADSVFEHYMVRPSAVMDDICHQDVTCFRGTTTTEQLLILRIAGDVQFHISPLHGVK